MSRVGKMPVTVPQGVDVAITADQITIKGSNGTLVRKLHPLVALKNDAGRISFIPANDSAEADALSGTFRKFGLGRNKIRELAFKGDIPGIVKASW